MKLIRILYLIYYIKKFDNDKFSLFLNHAATETGQSKLILMFEAITSVFIYNVSILEYFQFRFFEKSKSERKKWAGSGYMYEYQRIMNPSKARIILNDKTLFYKEYRNFMRHKVSDISDLENDPLIAEDILGNSAGKIVFKVADGKCGANVLIRRSADFDKNTISYFMKKEGYDLVEEYIIQHPVLMKLSPTAVNTVRIFTQLDARDEVEILGCRLRISVNSSVDNMAAGNMAAPIDELTGIITGPAVYSDIAKTDEIVHPVTGVPITGFQVAFWKETVDMIKIAAKLHPQNRSVGWDIAITEKGPDLIEGNHDWCKLVWQLPVKKGLKPILEKHLSEYKRHRRGD